MAWKFKKYRIKWNKDERKFKKKIRDRKTSYEAHLNWRRNRAKMKAALRKSKVKRKLTMKKNKARGIYKKLKIARERYKHLLKADIDMNMFVDNLLNESEFELSLSHGDLNDLIDILKEIKINVELEDPKEQKELESYIDEVIKELSEYKDIEELQDADKDFLEDIISFIEEYAEEIGELEQDD